MARKRSVAPQLAFWAVVLAVIGGGIAWIASRVDYLEIESAQVERGLVEQTVTAINAGNVKARKDAMVAAEIIARIEHVHVNAGDRVRAGDLLVELSRGELDAHVALAEANLRVGESRVRQTRLAAAIYNEVARTQVETASAQRQQATTDLGRLESLRVSNAIPRAEFDRASLALRVAQEVENAAVVSAREGEVRQEEVQAAESALEQLSAALDVAKATREKALVRAPFDGIVARIFMDEGESVGMGMPLLHLVQEHDMYVEAPFDEANSATIAIGQVTRIDIDARRDTTFLGEVSFISPVVTLNPDLSRTVNVDITLKQEDQGSFIPGMSADAVIVVDVREDTLFVPTQCVVRERFVYIIEGETVRLVEFEPGLTNWLRTEVRGGLSEGDVVVSSVGLRELRDGRAVTVVEDLDLR